MKNCIEGIKELGIKKKLNYIYTITGEKSLHKLYEKHLSLTIREKMVKSYIIDLHNTNKNLDWISE
jgi:hypothetical protein